MQAEGLDARKRVESHFGLTGQTVLVHILSDAAAGVAAHLGFRTVGVEDAHAEIRLAGRAYQHQPVASDARMGAAPRHRQLFGIRQGIYQGVDVDVVVACPLHFGKFYLH